MTKILIILVLVLGVLAVAQLARVYELTSKLRGKREEDISPGDNRMNAMLMWLFPVAYFAFFIWLIYKYGPHLLPIAASQHGRSLDKLYDFNWVILFVVFFLTNALLFYFAGKYVHSKDRKAFYYPHNNKLELLWTSVPAAFLAVIIIYGLRTWNQITGPASPDAVQVELYAKQFDWTIRYPGKDGVLGATDYRLINGTNPMGIVTKASIVQRLSEIDKERAEAMERTENEILPDDKLEELSDHVAYLDRMRERITDLRTMMEEDMTEKGEASPYAHGADDVVLKEFHLPVHREVKLLIRSQDVIHSAFIPHLRVQMNAVPGMTTTFKVTPTITTDSMRTVVKDDKFDFILLCNKVCGASHYNMQMPLTVEPAEAFDTWLKEQEQKPFEAGPAPEAAAVDTTLAAPDMAVDTARMQ